MRDRSEDSKKKGHKRNRHLDEPGKTKNEARGESSLPPRASLSEAKAFHEDRKKQAALNDEDRNQKVVGAFGAGTGMC